MLKLTIKKFHRDPITQFIHCNVKCPRVSFVLTLFFIISNRIAEELLVSRYVKSPVTVYAYWISLQIYDYLQRFHDICTNSARIWHHTDDKQQSSTFWQTSAVCLTLQIKYVEKLTIMHICYSYEVSIKLNV